LRRDRGGGNRRRARSAGQWADARVGHAEKWDDIAVEGDIAGRDCLLRYRQGGRVLAVASIYRDRDSLEAEVAMERESGS
jgi:hypothetical protein